MSYFLSKVGETQKLPCKMIVGTICIGSSVRNSKGKERRERRNAKFIQQRILLLQNFNCLSNTIIFDCSFEPSGFGLQKREHPSFILGFTNS